MELKIGQLHRMFRKDADYFTSIKTSYDINSLRSSSSGIILKIVPRPLFLVGKLGLGGILKFNCILLLRSWDLSRYFYIEMVSLPFSVVLWKVWIFVNFLSYNIWDLRGVIWTKIWYSSASAVPLVSTLWSLLCTINSWYTLVPAGKTWMGFFPTIWNPRQG